MTSRRTLLLGVVGTLVGTRLLAACNAETANEIVSATPAPSPDARSSVPTSNAAAATTVSSTASPSRAQTWEGADFSGLDSFIERTNGEAFAIWEGGSMIHEWYRTDSSYTRDVASAQKSILSLLFGRAIGDALVQLQTPIDDVLGTRWTPSGQSAGITVEHLLTMTSGLDDQRQVVAAPGERWIYSGAFAALFDVLTTATGRDLNDVAQEWLFSPSGATGSIFSRATGRAVRTDWTAFDGAGSHRHWTHRA